MVAVTNLIFLPKVSRRTLEMFRLVLRLTHRFVYFEDEVFFNLLILYIILTYFHDIFDTVPYLQILGQYGSGKSRVGDFLEKLCYNPLNTGDITDAALFRAIDEKRGPTAIIDEADDLSATGTRRGILLRILKTGYRRNGSVTRCAQGRELEKFSTFGPKIILNEGGIADRALASRCIAIHMMKSPRPLERLSLSYDGDEFKQARDKVRSFCDDYRDVVYERYDSFKGILGISGRNEEVWAPLIVLADLFAILLDAPIIRESIIKLAQGVIAHREKNQIIGNVVAQILDATKSYIEDPPVPARVIDGLQFHAGENLAQFIRSTWSIPNLRLERISSVLKHYEIIKDVKRIRLKKNIKGSETEVQRTCYALDEERLARFTK